MLKPNIKYRVNLTGDERIFLQKLIQKGNTAGYRIRHAQILLALDEIQANARWTDAKIGQAYGVRQQAVGVIRKQFVEEGFQAALERKKREIPPVIKIDGEAEAKIIALTCSQPPEGRCRWTLKLLANKVVEMGILDSICDHGIGNLLKKTPLAMAAEGMAHSHAVRRVCPADGGCIICKRLYDQNRPVAYLDQTNGQLIGGNTDTPSFQAWISCLT